MSSKFWRDFLIILGLSTVSFVLDITSGSKVNYYQSCPKIAFPVIFAHHFIWTFALFGWLSNNYILNSLYIITVIVYITFWILNRDKCFITEWTKNVCSLPQSHKLTSLSRHLENIVLPNRSFQKVYFILAAIFVIYKNFRNKNFAKMV